MKIYSLTFVGAQSYANRVHAHLIATDTGYAASVTSGQTTSWAVPVQDADANGVVIPTSQWGISIEPRIVSVFTAAELLNTVPLYVAPVNQT